MCFISVEIATLTRENGRTTIQVLGSKEVEQLIKQHDADTKQEEAKKQAASKK